MIRILLKTGRNSRCHVEIKMKQTFLYLMLLCGSFAVFSEPTLGHGEKAQEPFLRMRSILYYDVTWSTDSMKVGEEMSVQGKFHVFDEWPDVLDNPDVVFINVGVPGPVFLRKATYLNGKLMLNSTSVEIGGDYDFKVVLRARKPGTYHVHPMINIQSAGPIVGPGKFVEVQATGEKFVNEVTTITGQTVDLERYGLKNVVTWHVVWALIAIAWLIYWFRKPLFIPRMIEIREGRGEELITSRDRWVGVGFAVFTIALVAFGYFRAEMLYPTTVPLQAGRSQVEALEVAPPRLDVSVEEATYRIPGRTVNLTLRVTNNGDKAQRLGEFTTANLRFIDASLVKAGDEYPQELVEEGLQIEPAGPIEPGQTITLKIKATNPAWETEQLALLIYDPDSRFGGLLMFYDDQGNRSIVTIGGGLIPTFI